MNPRAHRTELDKQFMDSYQMAYNRQKAPVRLAICPGDDGQPAGFAQWQVWAMKVFIRAKAGKLV